MHGSYVVNEGVKGGRPPPVNNRSPVINSYKRCLCLIATIVVFTVATIVVLLALTSGPKKPKYQMMMPPPTPVYYPPPNKHGLYMDRINERTTTTTTATTATPTPERIFHPEKPQKSGSTRYWQQAEEEDEFVNREIKASETKQLSSSPTKFRLALITSSTTSRTTRPSVEFHELDEEQTQSPFQHQSNNYNYNEADNLAPQAPTDQFFYQQQDAQPTPQRKSPDDQIYFPGQQRQKQRNRFQKLQIADEHLTTTHEDEYYYHEEAHTPKNDNDEIFFRPGPQTTQGSSTTSFRTVPTTLRSTTLTHPPPKDIPARLQATAKEPTDPVCPKTCDSLHCIKSMSSILMRIDFEQDPCEDFYKYACNGLVVNQIHAPSIEQRFRATINQYLAKDPRPEPFLQKYRTFHESCLAFKCDGTTDPVVKFFRPLMNSVTPEEGVKDAKAHHLTHLIGRILLDGHLSSRVIPLFDVELEVDESTGGLVPMITMPTRPSLLQAAHSDDIYVVNCRVEAEKFSQTEKSAAKIMAAYEQCLANNTQYLQVLEKAMRIFEIFDKLPEFEREQRLKRILMTVEWEVLDVLKRLSDTEINRELQEKGARAMSVVELTAFCPAIEWDVLFTILFDGQAVDQVKVRFDERLGTLCKLYKASDFE